MDPPGGGTTTAVTLNSVAASPAAPATTTALTLTFDKVVPGLAASNITLSGVSGVTKGTLTGTGPVYTLGISGVTAAGTLTVTVANPANVTVSGSPKTATISFNASAIPVTFSGVTAAGTPTTSLTLTFSAAINGLAATDITLTPGSTGATKGALTGNGPTYTLAISGVTAAGAVTVAVAKDGYTITGSPQTVNVLDASSPPPPPPPPPGDFFDEAVGLTEGIGTYGSGAHSFEGGILTVTGNGGFSVALPAGFTVADTVAITLAARLVEGDLAKFISKQAGGWTDVTPQAYPQFEDTVDEAYILKSKGFNAAGITDGKAYFQTNGNNFKVQIKIISVAREEGAAVKITAPVPGLKPASGEAPKTTVETTYYNGTVAWAPTVTGNFVDGTAYTATIVLTKKPGFTFEGVEADAIDVVGADTVTHPAGGTGTLTITAVFPATSASAPDVILNPIDEGNIGGFNANVTLVDDDSGFKIVQTQGYDWTYGWVKVDFGTYTLGDYSHLDFTFTGVSGDTGSKQARVWITDTEPTGKKVDADAVKTSGNAGATTPKDASITLESFSALGSSHIVWVAFSLWAKTPGDDGNATTYTISNIKFHHGDE